MLTTRVWLVNNSGAIHPSVPVTPDLMENEPCPLGSCRQRPKSEMIARTSPRKFGCDRSTFCGLMSRCTVDMTIKDYVLEANLYQCQANEGGKFLPSPDEAMSTLQSVSYQISILLHTRVQQIHRQSWLYAKQKMHYDQKCALNNDSYSLIISQLIHIMHTYIHTYIFTWNLENKILIKCVHMLERSL